MPLFILNKEAGLANVVGWKFSIGAQSQALNMQEKEAVADSLCSTLCQHSYLDQRKALLVPHEALGSLSSLCSCQLYTVYQDGIHSSYKMTLK